MGTVQGPIWTLLIAVALFLLLELSGHAREMLADRRFRRTKKADRLRVMPEQWSPADRERMAREIKRQRDRPR